MKAGTDIQDDNFAALIGIDWADKKHDICEFNCCTDEQQQSVIKHSPESIEKWANSLLTRYPNEKVAVGCELKRGPLINALQRFDHIVIYPLNPRQVAHYRKMFASSGSKSDPVDASLQMEILRLFRHKLVPLKPVSTLLKQLSQLVEFRRRTVQERVKVTNRLTDILKQYYPQPLDWFGEKDSLIFRDFLLKWPNLQKLKRARKQTLLAFLTENHSRYPNINENRIKEIRTTLPLTEDESIIAPNTLKVQVVVPQLKSLVEAIDTLDEQIKVLYRQHADHVIYDSLPGAGACFAPRLLVAMGDDRERYQSADEVQKYCGIAPVIEASGKQSWTHWRYHCPKFLRQSFVEWAGQTVRYSYWAKAYYGQ